MGRQKKVAVRTMQRMDIDQLAALPGMYDLRMYDIKKHGLFGAEKHPERLVTGNPVSGEAWVNTQLANGLVFLEDLQEQRQLVLACIRKANGGGGEYDPASVANKKSGYGMKPSRKPTRDYKNGVAEGNGNHTGVVRMGRDHGPAKD